MRHRPPFLHRSDQLLAIVVQSDDQRDEPRTSAATRRVLGRIAGRAHATRPCQRPHDPDGLLHCGPSFASGGFIADSRFDGNIVINGSQQQFFVRNTTLDGWSNGVWNQVFAGDVGAPAQCFPAQTSCGGPYNPGHDPGEPGEAVLIRRRNRQLPGLRPSCHDELRW